VPRFIHKLDIQYLLEVSGELNYLSSVRVQSWRNTAHFLGYNAVRQIGFSSESFFYEIV